MKIKTLLKSAILIPISTMAMAGETDRIITKHDVASAQANWCRSVINISQTYEENGHEAAEELAREVIREAYAYDNGMVLFKPTLTTNPDTFRLTSEGALSYFVGGNEDFPQDTGFALNNWTQCRVNNAAVLMVGDMAHTMGKVHFTNADGDVTTVDKTWTFVKDAKDTLRITVHHSSLEHSAD